MFSRKVSSTFYSWTSCTVVSHLNEKITQEQFFYGYENFLWLWKLFMVMKTFYGYENFLWLWKHFMVMKTFCGYENFLWLFFRVFPLIK